MMSDDGGQFGVSCERFYAWPSLTVQKGHIVDAYHNGCVLNVLHNAQERDHAFCIGHTRVRDRPSLGRFEYANNSQLVVESATFDPFKSDNFERVPNPVNAIDIA
jgi:hypothetical protein